MKCGLFHTPYNQPQRTPKQIFDWSIELAQVCDKAGFSDFLVGEHYTLALENIPMPEAIIASAAMVTEKLRFAPMAHLLPYHDPATLAIRVGWLSQVLEGRYYLGVGPGGHHTDAILHGFDDLSELPARQLEALSIMEKVWKEEPFRFVGEYFRGGFPGPDDMPGYDVTIAKNGLWKGDPFEIAVTALSANSNSMKFAGARNYSPISFFGGVDQMVSHWETWSTAMRENGFTPERERLRVCREVFVADTDAEAKRRAIAGGLGYSWEHYLLPIYKKFKLLDGIIKDSGVDISADEVDMEFLAEHVWLCGSPETVTAKIEHLVDKVGSWGMLCINSHDNIDDMAPANESLQRFAQEVMPKVGASLPA